MSVHHIHLANFLTAEREYGLKKVREGTLTTLETFWNGKSIAKLLDANPDVKIFLDSGAHSLLNSQVGLITTGDTVKSNKKDKIEFTPKEFHDKLSVNQRADYASKTGGAVQFFADWSFNKNPDVRKYLDNYIEFVHKYKNQLLGYVNLDIIYNAEESWENQKYMESNGLRPIPVFHYGEDFKWLKRYVDNYDYIGIGGVAGGISLKQFVTSLGDRAFEYIAHAKSDLKVHGFAVTSVPLMKRYSWYSVDSTSWLKGPAFGVVLVPKFNLKSKEFDYSKIAHGVSVSDISLHLSMKKRAHYTISFNEEEIEMIERYFESAGVDKEKLQTNVLERRKVNIYYFEQLLKSKCLNEDNEIKQTKTFF